MAISLTGCATSTSAPQSDFCLIYEPVYVDRQNDTPETLQQVDRNNAAYEAVCVKPEVTP
jgi:hypothetical protein